MRSGVGGISRVSSNLRLGVTGSSMTITDSLSGVDVTIVLIGVDISANALFPNVTNELLASGSIVAADDSPPPGVFDSIARPRPRDCGRPAGLLGEPFLSSCFAFTADNL